MDNMYSNRKFSGDLLIRNPVSDALFYSRHLTFVDQGSRVIGAFKIKSVLACMFLILCGRNPLQIGYSVVRFVGVDMIYERLAIGIRNESESHRPMHRKWRKYRRISSAQAKNLVSLLSGIWVQSFLFIGVTNVAEIGRFIASVENWNHSPFFGISNIVNRHAGNLSERFRVWRKRLGVVTRPLFYYAFGSEGALA